VRRFLVFALTALFAGCGTTTDPTPLARPQAFALDWKEWDAGVAMTFSVARLQPTAAGCWLMSPSPTPEYLSR